MNDTELLNVGTSGWYYQHWKGPFYPGQMNAGDYLAFYAQRFCTVEINNSFYRLPAESAATAWHDSTPEDFVFAVKASRYITHMKKLKDPERSTAQFFATIEPLRERLGPILFQLPPGWKCNPSRLAEFINALPSGYRYAFEFRDTTWFNQTVYDILSAAKCALCIYDMNGHETDQVVTADFIYVRLHGPGSPYQGCYQPEHIEMWARRLGDWAADGKKVYLYFNNDQQGFAVRNALALQESISASLKGKE